MRFFPALIGLTGLVLFSQPLAADILKDLSGLNIPKPSVALKNVAIKSISLEDIEIRLETAVDNPYPLPLPKAAVDLGLNIEGTKLVKASSSPTQIAAKGATGVPFDLKLRYLDLVNIYKRVKGKEALNMALNGNFKLPVPIKKLKERGLYFKGMPNELKFPFKADRPLPAVLPTIALRNFKIIQPSSQEIKAQTTATLTDATIAFVNSLLSSGGKSPGSAAQAGLGAVDLKLNTEFELVLTNESAAQVLFESLKYNLMLGKEKFLEGDTAKIVNKGRESIVTVKTAFPVKGVTSSIAAAIKARKADFQLSGSSGLQVPALPGDGKLPFNFNKKGKLAW